MARPVCLFTGQWADLPLETLAAKAGRWGFDGLELACWGDHFDVAKAVSDPNYCEKKHGMLREYGLKASAFVDAGSVFGYRGPTSFGGQSIQVADKNIVRSSVGVGLTWASPFGALTVDYAIPLSKAAYDVVQPLRFSAGGF